MSNCAQGSRVLDPLRIGVTGSRYYADPQAVADLLVTAHAQARPHDGHVLVHGMCDPRHPVTRNPVRWLAAMRLPRLDQRALLGADWLAAWWAAGRVAGVEWQISGHPADWQAPCRGECRPGHRRPGPGGALICPAAGNYRNQDRIIDPGLDRLLAFYQPGEANTGTRDCVRRASRAGIDVLPAPPAEEGLF
jgi:hypothetical protein